MSLHPHRFGAAITGLVMVFGLLQGSSVADAATTSTWTGGGSSPNWSVAGNWASGVIPSSGGDVVFPPGVSNVNAHNDIPGLSLHSITVNAAGYALDGNRVTLNDATLTVATSYTLMLPVAVFSQHSLAIKLQAPASATNAWFRVWDLSGDGAVTGSGAQTVSDPQVMLGPASSFSGTYSSQGLGLFLEYSPPAGHPDLTVSGGLYIVATGNIGQLNFSSSSSRPTFLSPATYAAPCTPSSGCGGSLEVRSFAASGPYYLAITINSTASPEPFGKLVLGPGAAIDLTNGILAISNCAYATVPDQMTVVQHLGSGSTVGPLAGIASDYPSTVQLATPQEGTIVPVCGRKYWITYRGGVFHNDVVLTRLPSGYVLDRYGSLHQYGPSPAIADDTHAHWPGWDIARGLAVRADRKSGYTLDGWGGVHAFGGAPNRAAGAYWQGWDIARGLALRPDGTSGYSLDGWGGLHGFGGAPDPAPSAYWQGWDIARAISLDPTDSTGSRGYVLDGYGGVHAFGGAKPVRDIDHAYWSGWNIARGLVVTGDGQGYTLDGWGGVHGFGGLPDPVTSSHWQGWDIARGLSWDPVARGGYVVDGWGGLHVFSVDAQQPVPAQAGSAYWPGRDLARQVD